MLRSTFLLLALAGCHRVFGAAPADGAPPEVGAPVEVACCVPDQDCGAQLTAATCGTLTCMWSDGAVCTGTHATCETYGDAMGCAAHLGCGWTSAVCGGIHGSCDQLASADQCTAHGCRSAGTCTGMPNGCGFYSGNPVRCEAHACEYQPNGTCTGGEGRACEKYGIDQNLSLALCTDAGCTAEFKTCEGTPHGCDAHGEDACATLGCMLDPADCSGTPQEACGDFEELACTSHEGCGWSPAGGCKAPTTCAERSLDVCKGGGCELALCAP